MTDQNQENIPTNIPEQQLTQENTTQETPEQINWKKFREEKERDRQQRAEAEKQAALKAQEAEALKAALDAVLNKQNGNQKVKEPFKYMPNGCQVFLLVYFFLILFSSLSCS